MHRGACTAGGCRGVLVQQGVGRQEAAVTGRAGGGRCCGGRIPSRAMSGAAVDAVPSVLADERSAHSPARCWLGDSGSGDERLRVGRRWVTVAPEPTAAGSRSRALQLQGSAFTALHGISSVSLSRTRLQRPARTIHCASADHLGPLLQSRYAASPRFRHRAFPPLPLLLLSVSRAAVTAQCHWG